MRNGGMGCGWREEEDAYYDIKEVVTILLKEKLKELFSHKCIGVNGGRYYG